MARRSRFVKPGLVRLMLADVHKRNHQALLESLKKAKKPKEIDRINAEISESSQRVAQAESDGEWIEVKKELTAGEQRGVYGRLVRDLHFGEKASLIPEQVGLSKVVAYLVNWSLTDDGAVVPVSEDAINALDGATYGEIVNAIDWHEEQVDAEKAIRKNDQEVESGSAPTSSSVNG